MKYSWSTTMLVISLSLESIKKFLYQCHPHYTGQVSSNRVLYLYFYVSYNICIIYLHVIEEACLKVTFVRFYFSHSKILSNIIKNTRNSISIYCWKKILVKNIRNKCVITAHSLWRHLFFYMYIFSNLLNGDLQSYQKNGQNKK